jgi:formate dehydrogenase alpha subunit
MNDKAQINDTSVEIRPGESILDAARRAGIFIPTLCYDSRLAPTASCRLCLVKLNGNSKPIAACAHELKPNTQVITEDAELNRWRKSILRLVLSENPQEECWKCRQQELCELHSLTHRYAVERGFEGREFSGKTSEDPNPFILRDYSQCIHCYRCTRVCAEVEQAYAIAPAGRGFQTEISASFGSHLLDSPCTFCGQCIQTCPTSALLNRKMVAAAAHAQTETVRTICPYCGTGCGIELHVARDENKVVGVTPDWNAPANHGSLCVKGQFGLDFIHSSDRLTQPLIRRNGKLKESSWDEALDLIADRFGEIKDQSGPNAFAFWSSSRSTTESNYLMQKFARAVIGTNNVDNCART